MEITSKYFIYYSIYLFYSLRKCMDIYDELMKREGYDLNIHCYKACCLYALCNYKEAKVEAEKASDSELKNRLLF